MKTDDEILAYIKEHDGTTQRDIRRALSTSESYLSTRLKKFETDGLITRTKEGRVKKVHYGKKM